MVMGGGRNGWQQVQETAAAAAHMVPIERIAFELMAALMAECAVERMAVVINSKALSRFRTAVW